MLLNNSKKVPFGYLWAVYNTLTLLYLYLFCLDKFKSMEYESVIS